MPTLIQVSPDSGRSRNLLGVDDNGEVWRGEIKSDKEGKDYIEWRCLRSEFER